MNLNTGISESKSKDKEDEGTNSLMSSGIEYHEKTAWMLKSCGNN